MLLKSTILVLVLALEYVRELIVNFLAECLIIKNLLSEIGAMFELATETGNLRRISLVEGLHRFDC